MRAILDNLRDVAGLTGYSFVRGDICDRHALDEAIAGADAVINFAAESHVDRSIERASDFIETNVAGTQTLLDAARAARISRFVQISTVRLMGSCREGEYFTGRFSNAAQQPLRRIQSRGRASRASRAYHVRSRRSHDTRVQ